MKRDPLRLMIFDDTCRGRFPLPGLTHCWKVGGVLYRALGRFDRFRGVHSWAEALRWLAEIEPETSISEIQFWGHGSWGSALINGEALDERALSQNHPNHSLLLAVRSRLNRGATWWFRSCQTFGARPGQVFAQSFASFLSCRVAGHTFVIGPWQSGLHSVAPGRTPEWPLGEGVALDDNPDRPLKGLWSWPFRPNTITCLSGEVPADY